MNNINNQLINNICPRELNYNIDNSCIDFNKLQYNSRYHSYDFYAKSFLAIGAIILYFQI